jgi:signal transduction histidine kinase/CheY-like chemotaxis protein/HPt (histidine-containing phosphotransfer) domain-containing protein
MKPTTSVSTRFNAALAVFVAAALFVLAATLILSDFVGASRGLRVRTDRIAKLAAVSLAAPLRENDYSTISEVGVSLIENEGIAHLDVFEGNYEIKNINQPQFAEKTFEYFQDSAAFFAGEADIRNEDRIIGKVRLAFSREYIWTELVTKVALVFALSTLVLVAILAASRMMTRKYITRRLLVLEETATAIAGGDLEAEVAVDANDEIGRLAKDLGAMRDSILRLVGVLRSSKAELEKHNKTLGQRVSERTAELEEAIGTAQAAQRLAEEANRAKSDFLSNMSHELRTPLNAIIGFAELVFDDDVSPITEDQKESLSEVLKAGRHLLSLINDVLDLSKIEGGAVSLSIEPIDVGQTVNECLSLLTSFAARRNVELHNCIACTDLPSIKADEIRFKQVFLNLLTNAIKYNKCLGKVFVERAPAEPGMLRVGVRDEGMGISEDRISTLFEPFNRLGFENSAIEGTGIGLTITKELVEQMGGRIFVDSVVGAGATFWLEMQISEKAAECRDRGPGAIEGVGTGVKGRILYIEDNPANLELVRKIFSRQPGIEFIDAPNGELGIERARHEVPDVILLDINLPGVDGFQVLEQLRNMPETRSIPVIALTAAAREADTKRGQAAGFFTYLTKPIVARELMAALRRALQPSPSSGAGIDLQVNVGKVLIVDDMPIVLAVTREQLTRLGLASDVEQDPFRALEMLKAGTYGLALVDIGMPKMSGMELTRRLRAVERDTGAHTPVIALTAGYGGEGDTAHYRRAGIDGELSKPVNIEELTSTLRRWGASKNATRWSTTAPSMLDVNTRPACARPPVDVRRFREILGTSDSDTDQEMFDLFIASAPGELQSLSIAVTARDRGQTRFAAHRFKSTAAHAAAERLAELLHDIEDEAADGRWDRLERNFETVRQECERVTAYMLGDT